MDELLMLDFIQDNLRTPVLDALMVAVSTLGNLGGIWIVLGIVCACTKAYRRMGFAIICAVICAGIICKLIIGEIYVRPRPCDVNPTVALLIPRPFGTSFPSGHTASAFATLAIVARMHAPKGLCLACAVLACAIAWSRLYLYVHYLTDVLAGALIGCAIGLVAARIAMRTREGAQQ